MKYLLLSLFIALNVGQTIFSQCYPDRHNTSWFEGWVSCEKFPSPNEVRGEGHWILYDLKKSYRLSETHVWNVNDPLHLERGLQDVAIDISSDGISWTEAGTFVWDRGSGSSIYEGFAGPHFDEMTARYILITGLSNYGGECYGFSEIRFSAEAVEDEMVTSSEDVEKGGSCLDVTLYPNPFEDESRMMVQSFCTERIKYSITDMLGRQMISGDIPAGAGIKNIAIDGHDFPIGTYTVRLWQGSTTLRKQLLKAR